MKNKTNIYKILILGFIILFSFAFIQLIPKEENNKPYNKGKVHAPFNKQYKPEELGKVLSWIDCGKGLSAVAYHKGLLIAPMSFDFGGGLGDGAVVAYNVDDPKNPNSVFDSRDFPDRFHNENSPHYLGDIAENHGMYFHQDKVLFAERGFNKAGFMILDLGPLYDDNPESLPKIVSRYYFPDVEQTTVYDGFTFAPAWAGGRYVYAPTGSNGLYIIDTQNLDAPKLVAHLRKDQLYNQTLRSANAIGDLLILSPAAIASTKADIVLIDISNPEFPNLINRHTVKVGYQGIVYGSKYYNGAFSGNRGYDKTAEILAYDFADPQNIIDIELAVTEKLKKPEYLYVKDDDLYIGHYPGLSKWKTENDTLIFDVAIEPEHPKADDYAFVSPLGNLTVVTSDHIVDSRINIGVNQIEPDTKGPEVKYMLPTDNQKKVSITTKIGISFSDFISNETLENKAILIKERATGKSIDCDFGHGMGIVHAIPKLPLKNNITYDVFVTKNLKDLVGNAYEGKALIGSFSTGEALADFSVYINVDQPKVIGSKVQLSGVLNHKDVIDNIEYSWNFGDGSPSTVFSSETETSKIFLKPGNYNITLTARQPNSDKLIKASAVQVVHNKLPNTRPVISSSIVLSKDQKQLFVVNPDNNTLTAINASTGKMIYEIATGKNPAAVIKYGNELWVSCKGDDNITIHNAEKGNVLKTINLGYGRAPHGIVINEADNTCYVALTMIGQVQEVDLRTHQLLRNIQLDGQIRNLSYIPEKNKIVVPQFIATNQEGSKLYWINSKTWQLNSDKRLQPSLENDGLANGRGFPNYMGPIAVNPEQTKLWIPGKKDNLFRGMRRDGNPLEFDHTVRSLAVSLNIETETEVFEDRIDLDNSDFASAAIYNPFGNIVYITTMGSQTIWAIDAYNPSNQSVFSAYGEGPSAVLVNQAGNRLYIHNQLSRAISVFESQPSGALKFLDKWMVVGNEKLEENILEGKRLFSNTTRGSMTQEGYMSCVSCHIDGSHDGRIWDLSNLGEGFRNTIDLRGKAGMKHGMLHWSGNFDEVQDFNNQITALNEGTGFMFDNITKNHPQLKETKYGMHNDLDNLAAYVTSLNEYPKSPYKNVDGEMTDEAKKGRQLFIDLKCYSCHSGPTFTDSKTRALHNVGTLNTSSGERLGKVLEGLDTPSLISVWQNGPYFHDGSISNLRDVFKVGKAKEAEPHQRVNRLSETDINHLLDFIMQLDSEDGITAEEVHSKNTKPIFKQKEYMFNYTYNYDLRNHPIGKVEASDSDQNQNITYSLPPSGAAGLFEIDSISGEITFKYLDIYFRHRFNRKYGSNKSYWLDVVATDNGDFPKEATTRVILNVNYPMMPLTNQELKDIKQLNKLIDKGKSLNEKDRKRFEELNTMIKTRAFEESKYSD